MAILRMPDTDTVLSDEQSIRGYLDERGLVYLRQSGDQALAAEATDAEVLAAHHRWLKPFMDKHGYRTADVVRVSPRTANLAAIRDKFLREHTHSEDEVRFFVEGHGLFWFHMDRPSDHVFGLLCEQGDLISVPANTKHWFDLGDMPQVCAIRIFTDQTGWTPHYTDSGIEQRYRTSGV